MSKPSRTAELIEMKLDQPLVDYVRALRHDGASWQSISLKIAMTTGIAVNPETIRIWMANEDDMDRRKAGAA